MAMIKFLGIKRTILPFDLPIEWLGGEPEEQSSYFVLTDTDLVYRQGPMRLSANSLISKVNPILRDVFTRKGSAFSEVIDATCGYSLDSFFLLNHSVKVIGYENNSFAQIFIKYFQQRHAKIYEDFHLHDHCFSEHQLNEVQCLYLDPIFDDSRKRQSRLSMSLLQGFQHYDAKSSLDLLIKGMKNIRAGTIIVKSSKRQKPLLKGFVSSEVSMKSVVYRRFYTNYQELNDDKFFID